MESSANLVTYLKMWADTTRENRNGNSIYKGKNVFDIYIYTRIQIYSTKLWYFFFKLNLSRILVVLGGTIRI